MTTDHQPQHERARRADPPGEPRHPSTTDHRRLAAVGVRARRRLALLALIIVATVVALPAGGQAQTIGFPSVGTAFDRPGSFAVTVTAESAHTYYAPTTLGAGGLRHPVILWGNGTFNSPSTYDSFLRHLASHGFIVAAANTSNSGSGREMLAGLDNLTVKDRTAGNRFNGKVDLTRVAAMGYSQGGGGAMAAARDSRVDTTVAIQPWNASATGVRVPTLYLAGSSDFVVSANSVEGYFNASSAVPAAFGNVRGASHFEVLGDGGAFRSPATAWVRYFLMADANARPVFVGPSCTLCTSSAYTEYRANSRLAAALPINPPTTAPPTTAPPTTAPPTTAPPTTAPPTTAPPTTRPPTTCRWWFWWCR